MAVCERLKLNRTSEYFKVSEWPVVGKLDPVNLKIFSKREWFTHVCTCFLDALPCVHFQILILTLRAAFPNVIRFICCAGIIYLSYCFCGWIVLGPYHEKVTSIVLNTQKKACFTLLKPNELFLNQCSRKNFLTWCSVNVFAVPDVEHCVRVSVLADQWRWHVSHF